MRANLFLAVFVGFYALLVQANQSMHTKIAFDAPTGGIKHQTVPWGLIA